MSINYVNVKYSVSVVTNTLIRDSKLLDFFQI
jgi:hypothetical protein